MMACPWLECMYIHGINNNLIKTSHPKVNRRFKTWWFKLWSCLCVMRSKINLTSRYSKLITCKIKLFNYKFYFKTENKNCCFDELGGPLGKSQRSVWNPGGLLGKTQRFVWIQKPAENFLFSWTAYILACKTNVPQNTDQI